MSQLRMNDGMPQLRLTRSSHNLSNTTCFDVEQGWLVPTAVYDCVPGDRFNLSSQALIRTTALIKPAFTANLQAKSASFFVAYRTIWKAFEDFFSGGRSGNAKIPLPVFNINDELLQYSIFDYFGLPCASSNPINTTTPNTSEYINALYLLAYLKIWNDYFRNPSLDVEIDVYNLTIYKPNDDTPYDFSRHTTPFNFIHNGISYIGASVTIFLRWCFGLISNTVSIDSLTTDIINSNSSNPPSWQSRKYSRPALVNLPRDLFTSALPTASSSDPVSLGLSGNISSASISGENGTFIRTFLTEDTYGLGSISENGFAGFAPLNKGTLEVRHDTPSSPNVFGSPSTSQRMSTPLCVLNSEVAEGLSVRFSSGYATGIYPRELRLVFGLDLKQQIRNLSGNRYQDLLKAFYGVTTRDYRLNLAEYIGGSRYPIYTSEVLQTSETSNTPLGDQAGHAIGSGNSHHGSYFVEELGCILNLFWINSENIYAQELRRDWRKFSINDYFFPMFEKLGDQELLQEEICYTIKPSASSINSRIFGFVPRYSEYKFYNNTVKGGFRGNYRYWSQARFFYLDSDEVRLKLNSSFIKPNSVTFNRIFQTIDNDYTLKPYQVKFVNNTIAFRPMEENTIGYLIDHF